MPMSDPKRGRPYRYRRMRYRVTDRPGSFTYGIRKVFGRLDPHEEAAIRDYVIRALREQHREQKARKEAPMTDQNPMTPTPEELDAMREAFAAMQRGIAEYIKAVEQAAATFAKINADLAAAYDDDGQEKTQ